jgi:hypothetical protein
VNGDIASLVQSTRLVAAVAKLGSLRAAEHLRNIEQMERLRVLVFLLGLSVCLLGTWLIWPGYTADGRFYSYPVTGSLLATVAGGWLLILGVTVFVLKKMKRNR